MPPLVTIDVRDPYGPQPRGWGRYAGCLYDALARGGADGLERVPLVDGGWGRRCFSSR